MTETQKRIEAYQKILPDIKEKVIAVAMLLALSVIMLTSASFAWLTISYAPEVTQISTNITANGNLEIALASGTQAVPIEPDESKVGDSSASSGQSTAASNITWGNLINLSDPVYGLGNLTLRPAQLNTTALLTRPLYGALYSEDGRIEMLDKNFGYTSWVPPEGNIPGRFMASQKLGVRAISSIKITYTGQNAIFAERYNALVSDAEQANIVAGNTFTDITRNKEWMTVLAKILGIHMTATLNTEEEYINASITQQEMESFIAMYEAFKTAHEQEAIAIAKNINLQLFLAYGGDGYTPWEQSTVLGIKTNDSRINSSTGDFSFNVQVEGKDQPVTIKIINFKAFISDYNMLVENITALNGIKEKGDLRWTASGLKQIVAKLVNVDTCLIKKQSDPNFQTVKALMAHFTSGVSGAMDALGYKGKSCDIVITNGVLKNFEQRTGTSINVENMKVTATMYVDTMSLGEQVADIYAYITTDAKSPHDYSADLTYADTLNTGVGAGAVGEEEARDTYGLAVDFWVRTNAYGSYLVLEGNVLSQEKKVPAKTKDANGNEVDVYIITKTETFYQIDENGNPVLDANGNPLEETREITYDLYQSGGKWYNAESFEEFDTEGETPVRKMDIIEEVLGYEGENRVWQDNELITVDATTQGSGSCYVYYAETPEDQARSLELLKAMNVAFVDDEGTLLATAIMDTDRVYAESGRITVPLKLDNKSTNIGDGEETVYAITALEQNVATRITAIVYLDGTKIENDNVLAAADIQGQLNIQFGSSQSLNPISDEKLETAERSVTASVSPTEHNYDTATERMISRVTVNVTGDQPNGVTAFFLRQVNSTQGSKEEQMTFTKEGNSWVADYEFTAPGTYVLRSVQLDGVDYDLPLDKDRGIELPKVVVNGFSISDVSCSDMDTATRHINILTADTSKNITMSLKFATNDASKLPNDVQGRFIRADGVSVNVKFTLNPTTQEWSGNALFLNSGDYDFQYLLLDGKYVELAQDQQITASITLGMRVAVYTTSPSNFKYVPSEMTDEMKLLKMQVKILDNSGKEISTVFHDAKLYYNLEGSKINKLETDLVWNPSKGYYEGNLKALESGGPGNWIFNKVTVGTNTISTATTAAKFSIISPEPPSFASIQKQTYSYSPNGNAFMNISIKYSSTAKVLASISDEKGNKYQVYGRINSTDSETNITEWYFDIPKTNKYATGTQDGKWKLEEVYVWNYYTAGGDYVNIELEEGEFPTENQLESVMCINQGYEVKVVQTIFVDMGSDKSQEFGKSGNTVTGGFMANYGVSGISIKVEDFEKTYVASSAKLTITYKNNTSKTYGGYSNNDLENSSIIYNVALNADSDKKVFTQSEAINLNYAGEYTTEITFKMDYNGMDYSVTSPAIKRTGNVPTFKIYSVTPSVKITAAGTNGGSAVSFTDTSTSINFESYSGTCGVTNYRQPYADITLSGYGNASGATLTFAKSGGGTVHLYTSAGGSSAVSTYTWTANGACRRYVGKWQSKTGGDSKTAAGTLTATTLVLTYNGVSYEVDIADITISNPS